MAPAEGRGVPRAPHQERRRQENAGHRRGAEEDRPLAQHGGVPPESVQVGLSPDGAADRSRGEGNGENLYLTVTCQIQPHAMVLNTVITLRVHLLKACIQAARTRKQHYF